MVDEKEYLKAIGIYLPPATVRQVVALFAAGRPKYQAYRARGHQRGLVAKATACKLHKLWKEGKLTQFESEPPPLDKPPIRSGVFGTTGVAPDEVPAQTSGTQAHSDLEITLRGLYLKATGPDDKHTEWHLLLTLTNQKSSPTSIVGTHLIVERPRGWTDALLALLGDVNIDSFEWLGYKQLPPHPYLKPYETISGEIMFYDFEPMGASNGATLTILDAAGQRHSTEVEPKRFGATLSLLRKPAAAIRFASIDIGNINLGYGLGRRFARVRIENWGSQRAVGCRARLDIVEPSDWHRGDYKLNWKDVRYTAGSDTAPPVGISAGHTRLLDVAFTPIPGSKERDVNTSKQAKQSINDRIMLTSVEFSFTEASLASYATGLPTIESRHLLQDQEEKIPNAFGVGMALPPGHSAEGCWIAIPIALSAPGVARQAHLPPGKYKARITVTCDNGEGDTKTFLLSSPKTWSDLNMQEVTE